MMTPIYPPKKHSNDKPSAVVSAVREREEQQQSYKNQHQEASQTSDSSTTCADSTSLPFPWQLHAMLEAATNEAFEHIVSWHDNNSSFKVHEPNLFVQHVMPRFFKRQSKYKSFQRQLNIWQFERLIGSRGPCNGGYFHLFFHRYDTSSFHLMKRSKLTVGKQYCSLQRISRRTSSDLKIFQRPTLQYPSKCFSNTGQPECPCTYLPCMFFSQQKRNVLSSTEISSTSLISDDNKLGLHHDDNSGGGFVHTSNHSVCGQMGTSKTQDFPLERGELLSSSVSSSLVAGMVQKLCQYEDEEELPVFQKGCLRHVDDEESLETHIPVTHHSITSLVGTRLSKSSDGQPRNEDDDSTEVLRSSVLSPAELKYVLVGIKIAMTAG